MKAPVYEKPQGILLAAITGRSGSGKSTVAAHYAARGFPVADGDVVSREVTGPGGACLQELVQAFGTGVLNEDGTLNRRAMASIAFAAPGNNQELLRIIHPYIARRTLRLAGEARRRGHKLFFMDGAMVVGTPFQPLCDAVIVVTASRRLSVSRIILRDGISKTAAARRLQAQQGEAALRAAADYLIENDGTPQHLLEKADAVLATLRRRAGDRGDAAR